MGERQLQQQRRRSVLYISTRAQDFAEPHLLVDRGSDLDGAQGLEGAGGAARPYRARLQGTAPCAPGRVVRNRLAAATTAQLSAAALGALRALDRERPNSAACVVRRRDALDTRPHHTRPRGSLLSVVTRSPSPPLPLSPPSRLLCTLISRFYFFRPSPSPGRPSCPNCVGEGCPTPRRRKTARISSGPYQSHQRR